MKFISKERLKKEQQAKIKELEEEIELMRRIVHPHCIQLFEGPIAQSKIMQACVVRGALVSSLLRRCPVMANFAAHDEMPGALALPTSCIAVAALPLCLHCRANPC